MITCGVVVFPLVVRPGAYNSNTPNHIIILSVLLSYSFPVIVSVVLPAKTVRVEHSMLTKICRLWMYRYGL